VADLPKRGGSLKAPARDGKKDGRRLYEEAVAYRNSGQQQQAIALFRQSADLDYVPAMVELGESFMNDGGAKPANYPEAKKWLLKAARAGDSSAMVDVGGMYFLGSGGPEDFSAAAEWFGKAAKKDNPAALYDLGTMYENGKGVPRLPVKAKELYRRAAGLGNQEARKRLSELGESFP